MIRSLRVCVYCERSVRKTRGSVRSGTLKYQGNRFQSTAGNVRSNVLSNDRKEIRLVLLFQLSSQEK